MDRETMIIMNKYNNELKAFVERYKQQQPNSIKAAKIILLEQEQARIKQFIQENENNPR
jgi:hypothetical protein